MNTSITVLKLTLDALEVDPSISTVDDRKRVQKAIYLAQAQGLDLGYRYGWYIMGPYCPSLTQDYFKLHNELLVEPSAFSTKHLKPNIAVKLKAIVPLFKIPASFSHSLESWLELLASVHFLRKVSRKTEFDAHDVLIRQKPDIADFYGLAIASLTNFSLLP